MIKTVAKIIFVIIIATVILPVTLLYATQGFIASEVVWNLYFMLLLFIVGCYFIKNFFNFKNRDPKNLEFPSHNFALSTITVIFNFVVWGQLFVGLFFCITAIVITIGVFN